MSDTQTEAKPPWTFGPLYDVLIESFPGHRTKQGVFDVPRLAKETEKSHEAVYKWLRADRLTPANAKRLVELANEPENLRQLKDVDREPPTLATFSTFVFS